MTTFTLRMVLILIGISAVASYAQQGPIELPLELTQNPLTAGDEEIISEMTTSIQATEWLGPLAPIAISPFFGITILAGISQFGGDYLPMNSFVSNNPVLQNSTVFWVFLTLTFLTSLPRFTKVSKPAAQAIDQLEAYAGIITIILIKVLSTMAEPDPIGANTAMVVQMGALSFSADVLFSVAATVNIIVINSVKFFFEVMVWLIPFPFVDAALEIANKSLCAALMAIYAWSPMIATILNLIIFAGCLIAFRWVNRRVRYLRAVLCDPLFALISKRFGIPSRKQLVVFPQSGIGPFPAKSKLMLQPTNEGWQLVQSRFLLAPKTMQLPSDACQLEMQSGMILNSIQVSGEENDKLLFSKRFSREMDELSTLINVEQSSAEVVVDLRTDITAQA
jgi:hypothetical protein